ncbi:hypothetical protein K1T71_008986 [Dendrolimus kikuchii]|uniref:Uncharacterized protein n=1 Tax=Dendrolimus kikuchii TaxID=765133 RepID=A0ACC1CX28_9NEOP|nr:hypothetical protein K1T71_008986 [Dendrolimus kikuchii]
MADPEPRPPRGASAARKKSHVRSRGPYQDAIDADESAAKVAVTRRSKSISGRGRGAVRAVSVGAAPGVRPQDEPAGVTSVAAITTGATPEATRAGSKGAAKGKGAAPKAHSQADPAAETDGAALQNEAAAATCQKDAAVAATSSGAASPTSRRGGESVDILARSIALCEEIERMQSARQRDSGTSEDATDPVDPKEGDIERMGPEELRVSSAKIVGSGQPCRKQISS